MVGHEKVQNEVNEEESVNDGIYDNPFKVVRISKCKASRCRDAYKQDQSHYDNVPGSLESVVWQNDEKRVVLCGPSTNVFSERFLFLVP